MLLSMGLPENLSAIAWGLSLEPPMMIRYGFNNILQPVDHKVNLQMVNTKLGFWCGWNLWGVNEIVCVCVCGEGEGQKERGTEREREAEMHPMDYFIMLLKNQLTKFWGVSSSLSVLFHQSVDLSFHQYRTVLITVAFK